MKPLRQLLEHASYHAFAAKGMRGFAEVLKEATEEDLDVNELHLDGRCAFGQEKDSFKVTK